MSSTSFSHHELSLMLFALEGGQPAPVPDQSSCEEACPVVENLEELLCGGRIEPRQQLVRHLNNHLREGLIESGLFELLASAGSKDSARQPEGASDKLDGARVEITGPMLASQPRLAERRCDVSCGKD